MRKKLNLPDSQPHTVWKLPCTESIQPANKIFLLGQEFYPVFSDEGDTLVSDPIELEGFKCQDKVDFSISVKKETGDSSITFEYNAANNGTRSWLSDSTMELLMTIPNTDEYSLLWSHLSNQRDLSTLNGSFIDWPKESADLFLNSVATILMEKMEQTQFFREDVDCFLELVQNLDWGKNEKTLPEKTFYILTGHAFSSTRNPFFKSPLRYRYSDKCVGINAKDLASFCLAAGRLPNEKDLKRLQKNGLNLTGPDNILDLE